MFVEQCRERALLAMTPVSPPPRTSVTGNSSETNLPSMSNRYGHTGIKWQTSGVDISANLRTAAPAGVLDYQHLVALLAGYAKPRDKISALIAHEDLIRVRKGLYALGDLHRRAPLSRELLANLIYGPSYVSLEYALSHYGFIPERVETVTSVTMARPRRFDTPLGMFTYRPLPPERYSPGIRWDGAEDTRYLIASPEKALVDTIWTDKRLRGTNRRDVVTYLVDDLRIDVSRMADLDMARLAAIASAFASRKINLLVDALATLRRNPHE